MTPSAVVAHANLRSLSLALLLALGLGWTLLCDAAGKTTVCSITVNSSNEKDAFQRNLPKDKYQFVELLERGRRDWFPAACERQSNGRSIFFSAREAPPQAAQKLVVQPRAVVMTVSRRTAA